MPKAGDYFIADLGESDTDWGQHRYTDTRPRIEDEGYIKIRSKDAYRLKILSQRGTNHKDIFGVNLFYCSSPQGNLNCILRAQGNQGGDPNFAKQFSADNDLKIIGRWLKEIGAHAGDRILVRWTSPVDIVLELI